MARTLKEPIAVQPFLDWCQQREEQIDRELDVWPGISRDFGEGCGPRARLLAEIGWLGEHDARRYYRWRHDLQSGLVERGMVEDALDHAGVDFYDVYPDIPRSASVGCKVGEGRRMTDAQVLAAHRVYWDGRLSVRQVSDLLWERYGYASVESCASQLRCAFVALGLPRRSVEEANLIAHRKHGLAVGGRDGSGYRRYLNLTRYGPCQAIRGDGSACVRAAKAGTQFCGLHQPEEMARRAAQIAVVNAQGKNMLRWANREGVAA